MMQMDESYVTEFLKYARGLGIGVSGLRKGSYVLIKDDHVAKLTKGETLWELVGGGDWAKELYGSFRRVQVLAQAVPDSK